MGLLEDFKKSQPGAGLLEGFREQKEQTDGGLLSGFKTEAVSSVAPLLVDFSPYDPSQPPEPGAVEGPYGEILRTYGLLAQAIGVPFERLSKAVAAPVWKLLQAATPDIKKQMIKGIIDLQATASTIGLGAEAKQKEIDRISLLFPELKEKIDRKAARELPKTFKNALKALIPLPGMAKDTESVAEIASDYYEEMTGEKPAFWYGGAMDFASTIVAIHGVQRAARFVAGFAKWAKEKSSTQIRPARAEADAAWANYQKTGDRTQWDAVRIKYAGIKPERIAKEAPPVKDFGKYPLAKAGAKPQTARAAAEPLNWLRAEKPELMKAVGNIRLVSPERLTKIAGEEVSAVYVSKMHTMYVDNTLNKREQMFAVAHEAQHSYDTGQLEMSMEDKAALEKRADVTEEVIETAFAKHVGVDLKEDIIAAAYYEDKIAKIESALLKTPDDKILQTSLVMAKRGLMKATGKIAASPEQIAAKETALGAIAADIPMEIASKNVHVLMRDAIETELAEAPRGSSLDYLTETPEPKARIFAELQAKGIPEDMVQEAWDDFNQPIFAPKKPVEPPSKNPYLRMPLDRVKEDAANGVRLAKDALVELQEVIINPASTGQKNKIIRTAVGRGLEHQHLSALSKQITGIEDLDLLTSEDADELLKTLDNYRYMDTWKTESITKEPDKLVDPAMSKTQMAGILKASGSIEAYNKTMIYSQKLGGAPSDPALAAIWHRDMINHARYMKREIARQEKERGEANILNPYQSISYALDKAERRTGIPLRRQWSDMVADVKGWNYKNEERMWTAIRNAKVHRLGIVTNRAESTKIAKWLNEGDEALRLNMWNDMSSKTQALATELDGMLQEYAPFLVRWGRFLVWDRHARIGEKILNDIHAKGKTPTDKQISKAQKLMREKKPPDAPMSALAEGRAARDLGQLADWLDTQGWGTRKRYYMSEGAELSGDIYEGSISEEIFGKAPEAGELTTEAPRELMVRRGKGAPVISTNAALDVLRHLDRLSAFASTYENRMNFWEAFRSTNPNKDDLGLMRDADRALRGIMPRTLPIIKSFRDVNRFFWRSYLVFDPAGSLWFAWRQLLQNVAFDASQFNGVELMKSIRSFSDMSKAQDWAQNNPDAAESFMDFYNRNVAENRSFYRHFIMKSEEAGGLEMTSKAGTLIDMLAITPGITDSANRMAVWPVAYDIAQRNIAQFRDGKLSPQGLWNRLALNTITPGQSMEMTALLRDGKDAEFMSRYAEYKTENIHFRYNPLLRSLQEMTPTGRVTLGLLTFPRGVMNIAIKNGLEPIASMAANPSTANARRSYDGFKTLIKLFAGTSVAQSLSIAITGVSAYGLWKLLFGPSLLAPGFGKVVELLDENAFILHQAEQSGASLHETATKMVANAAKNLEMFIPLAEVMKRGYEVQENRDGVYLYDLAIKYAKEEFLKQYQKPFDYRSRELHEKIQYMVFGKEQPKGMKSKWKESFNLERIKKW